MRTNQRMSAKTVVQKILTVGLPRMMDIAAKAVNDKVTIVMVMAMGTVGSVAISNQNFMTEAQTKVGEVISDVEEESKLTVGGRECRNNRPIQEADLPNL